VVTPQAARSSATREQPQQRPQQRASNSQQRNANAEQRISKSNA
jgi:hypothetical protein